MTQPNYAEVERLVTELTKKLVVADIYRLNRVQLVGSTDLDSVINSSITYAYS